ncbi:MAG: carbon-nitrogen hydrolase family protein [Planctomycetota bacterium]|nr:carbon-nitrogen hydrolase family protein [Planctomycetota bacterium]
MKIAHAQLICTPGDFDANFAKVKHGIARAREEGVEILSFPECFLTGYQDNAREARKHGFAADSKKMKAVLASTRRFGGVVVVGFNEHRGPRLYNTVVVARQGEVLGFYSKCAAYMPFHTQGRSFPVFDHKGLRFGVIICADGGYIEPSRILALKGARLIVAPHYNYIPKEGLLEHFQMVRADHIARAVENRVYFVRGNNVCVGKDPGMSYDGVGYGDSYVIDPIGELLVRSRRHVEDFMAAEINADFPRDKSWGVGRSAYSFREYGKFLLEAMAAQEVEVTAPVPPARKRKRTTVRPRKR